MVCMVDLGVLFLQSLLTLVTHVLFCCLHLSTCAVDPVQICYTYIVLLFTPQYTYSGPSTDLLHIYCSAVYTSVHVQWTQFRFVTHILFCCLHLSTHTVDPVQICYTCIVLWLSFLHLTTHPVDPVLISLQSQWWMSFGSLANLTAWKNYYSNRNENK